MSFLTLAALAVGLLVVAPVLAHLLRRRPPEELPFAATKLVPQTTAVAHRRTAIEDRALFSIRALAILALAVLGATPFVTCSRLSLARDGGASVALTIVLDDSMSMRVPVDADPSSPTRFERSRKAADELLRGLADGDAVSVVLAGDPPRVALAATSNVDAARAVVASAEQSDRGTDLDGAIDLAGELLSDLRHVDKRVVVLSDLAGRHDRDPLTAPEGVKLWVPLEELRETRPDCGIVGAERTGLRIDVRLACGAPPEGEAKRRLEVRAGDEVLVDVPFRADEGAQEVSLTVTDDASAKHATLQWYVRLLGDDALAIDDEAPVVALNGALRAGLVSDTAETAVATGGPPPIEQAVQALHLGVRMRPLSDAPDREQELDELGLLVVDDVPGFTPTQRRELAAWVERGGVLLLALGPNAAAAPLGQGFDPLVPGLLRWTKEAPAGVNRETDTLFADAGVGIDQLSPQGRTRLELEDPEAMTVLTRWTDGAPFALERRSGRGVITILTLPFSTEVSDLALRPGFLELLKRAIVTARTLGGVARTTVGQAWTLNGFDEVKVERRTEGDAFSPIPVEATPGHQHHRAVPAHAGLYRLVLDGNETTRVAEIAPTEVDFRPGPVADAHTDEGLGGVEATIDVSSHVAMALLALLFAELLLRAWGRRQSGSAPDEGPPSGGPVEPEPASGA